MSPALTQADRAALRARLAAALVPDWRTRFAPAPTGHLHLGHAVNAVYVWSIARAFGGAVIVRLEDHDRQRARDHFETSIREDLAWLGLHGDNAALGLPSELRQSGTPAVYTDALDRLLRVGHVYPCCCSRRDIAERADAGPASRAAAAEEPAGATVAELRYPGTCRQAGVRGDETPARRLELADARVTFDDLRHGTLAQRPAAQCGDLLLRDRAGQWTYQFAVVADDLAQRIDLIIRGDDLLPSTGRQLQLAQALGRVDPPLLLHHPLLVHPDGTKLSKSRGDTGIRELRAAGWDAPRVLGHAAWLGGLQDAPDPLRAADLARLWAAPVVAAAGTSTEPA